MNLSIVTFQMQFCGYIPLISSDPEKDQIVWNITQTVSIAITSLSVEDSFFRCVSSCPDHSIPRRTNFTWSSDSVSHCPVSILLHTSCTTHITLKVSKFCLSTREQALILCFENASEQTIHKFTITHRISCSSCLQVTSHQHTSTVM